MSVRRVQEAGGQDGRAQGGQGRCEEQLEGESDAGELCACSRPRKALEDAIDDLIIQIFRELQVHNMWIRECYCGPRSAKRKTSQVPRRKDYWRHK